MVSRKTERLINLTIALLATKRYLNKAEIFRSVSGYEGSDESKERMFERDKDGLRNLGVRIEVGSFDPLFEDEAGYRIKPEGYSLDLGAITGTEIALLSLAAEAWRGAALDGAAQSALTKLGSMGIESDLDSLPAIAPRLLTPHEDLQSITRAISKRSNISFIYLSPDLKREVREIQPYAIATRDAHWYVGGYDVDRSQVRTFRLDRIDGAISIRSNKQEYEIPTGFDLFASLVDKERSNTATLDIRKGKAELFRNKAKTITGKGEWDQITLNYSDERALVDLVLWHGLDVLVIQPQTLRSSTILRLQELVALHG